MRWTKGVRHPRKLNRRTHLEPFQHGFFRRARGDAIADAANRVISCIREIHVSRGIDGHAGGVGIAARGFEQFEGWVADTAELLAGCPCERGCPSCVQSPKCGNLNDMLDKSGALTFLQRLVDFGGARSS